MAVAVGKVETSRSCGCDVYARRREHHKPEKQGFDGTTHVCWLALGVRRPWWLEVPGKRVGRVGRLQGRSVRKALITHSIAEGKRLIKLPPYVIAV